jgi:predicted Zn-dependent peptidase
VKKLSAISFQLSALFTLSCASSNTPVTPPPAPAPAAETKPAQAAEPVNAPQYMTAPPQLPAPKTFLAPAPVVWKLKNGLEVVLVEKHTAPLVGMMLVVKAGSNGDPAKKTGVAELTADMLDEGAGGKSAFELAAAIEQLGAQLHTAADIEGSQILLNVLSSRFDDAAALFADVALRPNFDAKEFERVRGEHVARLIQRRVEPRSMAQLALAASLYGDTAYGRPVSGYVASVQPLKVDDVKKYYATWYHPNAATLVVVGDITADALRPRIEKLFGGWKGNAPKPPAPSAAPKNRPRVVLVDKPDAPQSTVRIGEPSIPRASADYAPLQTAMTVLGGSFTSRLERNLRERNNFTYGASAGVSWRRGPSAIIAQADVFTKDTAPALAEFMKELDGIRSPVSDEELGKAKALERQSLVQQMQSAFFLAAILGNLVETGLPADTYRKLDAELAKLSIPDLQRAAEKYIHPKYATIVVVGDLTKIRPAIEKLGLGAIELRDAEGKKL